MTADATVEVLIRGLAAGGSGVGDLADGRVVFVPRTAPGDRARVRIDKEKARWAVGSVVSIVEPGPDRSEPHCRVYARCGGCQIQHLPYARQLEWKGRFVADALRRIGALEIAEPPEVVASPRETRYRNRITLTLRRLRGGRVVAGFHALGRPAHVIDIHDECVLPEPALSEAWTALRASWGGGARLLPDGGRLRLTLRARDHGVELVIEGGAGGWVPERLLEVNPRLTSVRHLAERPAGRSAERGATGGVDEGAANGPTQEVAAERGLHEMDPDALGTAFVQVNREVAALLRDHVLEVAGSGAEAVDAYCGVGSFGRALAETGWNVVGIEHDPVAVAIAQRSSPSAFRVVRGLVEERLAEQLPADLLLVNPPRSGLHRDVPGTVLAAPPARIVYVSCDPATLARDVSALAEGYELRGLRSFDLFPQTAHVETVAVLVRREGGP
jgi:23S rRNA (uracil1939-C5)-methyltransferase